MANEYMKSAYKRISQHDVNKEDEEAKELLDTFPDANVSMSSFDLIQEKTPSISSVEISTEKTSSIKSAERYSKNSPSISFYGRETARPYSDDRNVSSYSDSRNMSSYADDINGSLYSNGTKGSRYADGRNGLQYSDGRKVSSYYTDMEKMFFSDTNSMPSSSSIITVSSNTVSISSFSIEDEQKETDQRIEQMEMFASTPNYTPLSKLNDNERTFASHAKLVLTFDLNRESQIIYGCISMIEGLWFLNEKKDPDKIRFHIKLTMNKMKFKRKTIWKNSTSLDLSLRFQLGPFKYNVDPSSNICIKMYGKKRSIGSKVMCLGDTLIPMRNIIECENVLRMERLLISRGKFSESVNTDSELD